MACSLAVAGVLTIIPRNPVLDADVWLHLKTGEWILQHGAFPRVGIFSRLLAGKPWADYSWGSEVPLAFVYSEFGLMGLAWFQVVLILATFAAFAWMLLRLSGRFWFSWIVATLGAASFLFNVMPRPLFVSAILTMVTLTLLLEAERTRDARQLYWLPLVFILWANCHIQFIHGLFAVGVFCAAHLARAALGEKCARFKLPPSPFSPAVTPVLFLVCAAACLVNPYTYTVYRVVFEYASSKFPYRVIEEFQPISFHYPSDYILVLLLLAAVAMLVRSREWKLFETVLLLVFGYLSVRTVRDAWLGAVVAGAILACGQWDAAGARPRFKFAEYAAGAVLLAALLMGAAHFSEFNPRGLDRTISRHYPVDAVNFVHRHRLPGPLYNFFGWGDFLIWYMPDYPVSIDGRTDLYGDDMQFRAFQTASGDSQQDAVFAESRLVLLPAETPLAQALANDPRFRLVYSDAISAVYVRVAENGF